MPPESKTKAFEEAYQNSKVISFSFMIHVLQSIEFPVLTPSYTQLD